MSLPSLTLRDLRCGLLRVDPKVSYCMQESCTMNLRRQLFCFKLIGTVLEKLSIGGPYSIGSSPMPVADVTFGQLCNFSRISVHG